MVIRLLASSQINLKFWSKVISESMICRYFFSRCRCTFSRLSLPMACQTNSYQTPRCFCETGSSGVAAQNLRGLESPSVCKSDIARFPNRFSPESTLARRGQKPTETVFRSPKLRGRYESTGVGQKQGVSMACKSIAISATKLASPLAIAHKRSELEHSYTCRNSACYGISEGDKCHT
jgi:hypothetical protein